MHFSRQRVTFVMLTNVLKNKVDPLELSLGAAKPATHRRPKPVTVSEASSPSRTLVVVRLEDSQPPCFGLLGVEDRCVADGDRGGHAKGCTRHWYPQWSPQTFGPSREPVLHQHLGQGQLAALGHGGFPLDD